MPTTPVMDWGVATWTALAAGLATFYNFIPRLIIAIIILLVAWGVANALYSLTRRLLTMARFDSLMGKAGVNAMIDRSGTHIEASSLAGTLVKWSVLLLGFMMAAEALDLPQVSSGFGAIIGYIPNVIAAVIILTLGLLLAGFISRIVRGAASSANVRASHLLADLSYWAIAIFAALGAIQQLKIAPTLVQTLYTAAMAALALGAALAFGLGLRSQARDVVVGRSLSEQIQPGDELTLDQVNGTVERVGSLTTLVRTKDGATMSLPNHFLADHVFKLSGHRLAMAGGGGGGGFKPKTDVHLESPNLAPLHHDEPLWRPDEPQSE
jgi:small-conductance mechanosensitive channel